VAIVKDVQFKVAVPSPAVQLQIKEAFASTNALHGEALRSAQKAIAAMNSTRQLQETLARLHASLQTPAISSAIAAALYKPVASPAAISALAEAVNETVETNRDDIFAVAEAGSSSADVADVDTVDVTTFVAGRAGVVGVPHLVLGSRGLGAEAARESPCSLRREGHGNHRSGDRPADCHRPRRPASCGVALLHQQLVGGIGQYEHIWRMA
jgi:hypothetical protein